MVTAMIEGKGSTVCQAVKPAHQVLMAGNSARNRLEARLIEMDFEQSLVSVASWAKVRLRSPEGLVASTHSKGSQQRAQAATLVSSGLSPGFFRRGNVG